MPLLDTGLKYIKYAVNGQTYYDAIPNTGDVPSGASEVNYDAFLTGAKNQAISRLQNYQQGTIEAPGVGQANRAAALKAFNEAGGETALSSLLSGTQDFNILAKATGLKPEQFNPSTPSGVTMVNGIPTDIKGLQQEEANKAAVAAGTMKNIGTPEAPQYVPAVPTIPPAPVAPAPPTPAVASPGAPATPPTQVGFSGTNLIQGSTGPIVSQLQSALGITADGKFGPKTVQAVKDYQLSHGLKVDGIVGPQTMAMLNKPQSDTGSVVAAGIGSGGGGRATGAVAKPEIPSTGNPAIDSLIGVLNNQSPQKTAVDIYKEVYGVMGLDTIKENYAAQTKAFSDLQEKKNDEAQEIKNNPWYSEGIKVAKLRQLDAKYETRELILGNKLKLLETQIDNGRADAQFIAGKTLDQLQQGSKLTQDVILKAIDIVEKQAEAERKTASSSAGGKELFELLTPSEAVLLGVPYGTTKGGAKGKTVKKPMGQTQVTDLTQAQLAKRNVERIAELVAELGAQGPILGRFRTANPYDTRVVELNNLITQTVPGLARGIFKEVGVLTDTDINRYTKTLANTKLTKEQADNATKQLLKTINYSIKTQLETLDKSGRDVREFEDLLLSVRGGSKNTSSSNNDPLGLGI